MELVLWLVLAPTVLVQTVSLVAPVQLFLHLPANQDAFRSHLPLAVFGPKSQNIFFQQNLFFNLER